MISLQDKRGGVFDAIVYAEKAAQEWLAGSNNHQRTQSFNGGRDEEAGKRTVHVAITYEGTAITGYRDGRKYGKRYLAEETATFQAGDAEILLGCRHGAPAGNRCLQGRILRARLYDRALTPAEIEASRLVEATAVTEHDVLDALTNDQLTRLRQWQTTLEHHTQAIDALRGSLTRWLPETSGWESLALSIINLKEFVYLK